MEIRRATPADLLRLLAIYSHARHFMANHGNPHQWGPTHWPPRALIEQDIAAGKSYVCVAENRIVGVFYYDYGKDVEPTYRTIDGRWQGDDTYGVIHRIASDGSLRGVGTFCVNWAYRQCGHLRIDTHADNGVMRSLLEKNGFSPCGIIYVREDRDPRIAYEKQEA